jgi:hypothetical protein
MKYKNDSIMARDAIEIIPRDFEKAILKSLFTLSLEIDEAEADKLEIIKKIGEVSFEDSPEYRAELENLQQHLEYLKGGHRGGFRVLELFKQFINNKSTNGGA